MMRQRAIAFVGLAAMACLVAHGAFADDAPQLFGLRTEFLLFALTLFGVALLHERTLEVAVSGLGAIVLLKFLAFGSAFDLPGHLRHEAVILINLFGLLIGFAILARHFEQSGVPAILPRWLPDDWKGGFVLLVMVFVLSAFLDNIAAAMIGGTVAKHVFRDRLDIGYLAAIVAASNAGGAGSVVGDTTTTMMWIDGVDAADVLHAYVAAVPALLLLSVVAARQQHAHQPITRDAPRGLGIAWRRVVVVVAILLGAIVANVLLDFPAVGVWMVIGLAALFVKTDWQAATSALKGSLFLLLLVLAASLMPVEELPPASWTTALVLGFVSAVFDNIPLTKLALDQGGYDWGVLAYAVGFGGSMIWFGSSAGVALSGLFPQARSIGAWLWRGWHVVVAYLLGFFVLLATLGWQPQAPHRAAPQVDSALGTR